MNVQSGSVSPKAGLTHMRTYSRRSGGTHFTWSSRCWLSRPSRGSNSWPSDHEELTSCQLCHRDPPRVGVYMFYLLACPSVWMSVVAMVMEKWRPVSNLRGKLGTGKNDYIWMSLSPRTSWNKVKSFNYFLSEIFTLCVVTCLVNDLRIKISEMQHDPKIKGQVQNQENH